MNNKTIKKKRVHIFKKKKKKKKKRKAGALLLEPYLHSILLWLFWRWGLTNYLLGPALKAYPPSLSVLSS
jgi:hypothetical protein